MFLYGFYVVVFYHHLIILLISRVYECCISQVSYKGQGKPFPLIRWLEFELFYLEFSNIGLVDMRNARALSDVKSVLMAVTFFRNLSLYQLL